MGNSASNMKRSKSDSVISEGKIAVYGVLLSPNTQRVLAALAEKDLTYNLKKINFMESEHKSRKYLDGLQPFGLFPVLVDEDGFKIYESRAICRYLEEKYKGQGTELIPTGDIKARFIFEQAVYIEAFNFDPPVSVLVREKYFKKLLGRGEPDEVKIAECRAELNSKLDVYDKILSKQPYLAGQNYTLADLFHLPYGTLLFTVGEGDLIESRANVKRWWEKISSRSAWKAVQAMAK